MKQPTNQAVGVGVAGGGIGLVLVWLLPQITDLVIEATEASALTIAFSAIVSWIVRYLPKPRN